MHSHADPIWLGKDAALGSMVRHAALVREQDLLK
jgi:hypothetical protein